MHWKYLFKSAHLGHLVSGAHAVQGLHEW